MPSNSGLFSEDVVHPYKKQQVSFHQWHGHFVPCTAPLLKCATLLTTTCWLRLHQHFIFMFTSVKTRTGDNWINLLWSHIFPDGTLLLRRAQKQRTRDTCTWKLSIWDLQTGEKPSYYEGHWFCKWLVIMADVALIWSLNLSTGKCSFTSPKSVKPIKVQCVFEGVHGSSICQLLINISRQLWAGCSLEVYVVMVMKEYHIFVCLLRLVIGTQQKRRSNLHSFLE